MPGRFICTCKTEWVDMQPTYRENFQDYPCCPNCGAQMTKDNMQAVI